MECRYFKILEVKERVPPAFRDSSYDVKFLFYKIGTQLGMHDFRVKAFCQKSMLFKNIITLLLEYNVISVTHTLRDRYLDC